MLYTKPAEPEKYKPMEDPKGHLNNFLDGRNYVSGATGAKLTLADISIAVTVSSYEACEFDVSKYPNVAKWLSLCKNNILDGKPIKKAQIDLDLFLRSKVLFFIRIRNTYYP